MNTSTRTFLTSLALLAFAAYAPATLAASASTTFNVTATVDPVCSVASNGNLAFGDYSGTRIDVTTTVSVTCTNGAAYTVGLDNGFYYNGTHRRMKHVSSADYLVYDLYSDSGRTTIWNGVATVAGTGTGSAQSLIVYGLLFGGQNKPIGDYADTITVTVNYM